MNMMKYCPECYKELPPNSSSCPYCGYIIDGSKEEEPQAPGFLKTPKIDSFIPPEQTTLSFLLLIIFFWGVNISLTLLPIFLNAATLRNVIIAGIGSQIITRIMVGLWAVEEVSLQKDITNNQKIGAFSLTFVPIGAILSFLKAARSSIRKERLSNLTISCISAVLILFLILYSTANKLNALAAGADFESLSEQPLATETQPSVMVQVTSTFAPTPTPTPRTYLDGCRNPLSVVPDEEGNEVEVCGTITNFGVIACDSCPRKFYSFVKLDSTFQVVSYEWRFTYQWLGRCVRVTDEVELLGASPIFVYNMAEGCSQDECIVDSEGGLADDSGVYFQPYDKCQ
jgi:hypothetical protein